MLVFNELNDDNLFLYAAKHYYNPKCIDVDEFYEDLNRFKYIKRLVNRYLDSGSLSERLILNHLIVIFNSFGVEATLKMLEYKMSEEQWPVLKPFLIFLKHISSSEYVMIKMDQKVVDKLRTI